MSESDHDSSTFEREPALLAVMAERAKMGLDPEPGDWDLSRAELLALYELEQEEPRVHTRYIQI